MARRNEAGVTSLDRLQPGGGEIRGIGPSPADSRQRIHAGGFADANLKWIVMISNGSRE